MDKQMIEEMAKDLGIAFQLAGTTRFGAVAEILVDKWQRKIPESSVVVSKQVWEEHIENWDKCGKTIEERVRKETAEKFAERAKQKLEKFWEDYEDEDGKVDKGVFILDVLGVETLDGEVITVGLIDEIAKEITEGKA